MVFTSARDCSLKQSPGNGAAQSSRFTNVILTDRICLNIVIIKQLQQEVLVTVPKSRVLLMALHVKQTKLLLCILLFQKWPYHP